MLTLEAKIRTKKADPGQLAAVLYGPKVQNTVLEVNQKEFEKVFNESGESTLIALDVENKKFKVLVYGIQRDPLIGKIIHVDFYQPRLDEEIEATVPIVFEGEAPGVKSLGGTLVKNLQDLEVKALPEKLPHEIKVNLGTLETFDDEIKIKDLEVGNDVKIMKDPEELVAKVVPAEDVEAQLEAPIQEELEKVEVEEKGKEEPTEEEAEVVKDSGEEKS